MATRKKSPTSNRAPAARKSVIVTFKPKDQRRNKSADKMELLTQCVPRAGSLAIYDVSAAAEFSVGSPGLPPSMADDLVGYDVNLYDAPIVSLSLSDDEVKSLRGYGFFTLKPVIVVYNASEGQQVDAALMAYAHKNAYVTTLQGKLEAEILQLDAEGAEMFMSEYGITERGAAKVIRLSYELMRYLSFFTVGPDEVRAWTVSAGAAAPEAAGVIHSDLQKGFIRAEVFSYDDLVSVGSEAGLKSAGKFRLEGKEYLVKDGDILNIRFSQPGR